MASPASRTTAVRLARLCGQTRESPLDVRCQHVAAAAHGLDQLRLAAVILELAAQAADGDVDRAVERPSLAPAQQVQQHVARQHPVRPFHQGQQQVIFTAGQRDFHAIGAQQPATGWFQRPARETQRRGIIGAAAGAIGGAAQHGAHAGQQFAGVERLGHVVVGAQLQPDDAVGLLTHGREHHDRHVALAAHPAGQFQPTLAGQHQVEHHQLEVPGRPRAPRLPCVADGRDPEAVSLQEAGKQVAYFPVIIDDEDVRHRFHAGMLLRHTGSREQALQLVALCRATAMGAAPC
jgi:hypothetical protein